MGWANDLGIHFEPFGFKINLFFHNVTICHLILSFPFQKGNWRMPTEILAVV